MEQSLACNKKGTVSIMYYFWVIRQIMLYFFSEVFFLFPFPPVIMVTLINSTLVGVYFVVSDNWHFHVVYMGK